MDRGHPSWENRKPRNGRESKLKRLGKPTPEWTKEHGVKHCRVCKSTDREPYLKHGVIESRCVACKRRNQRKWYSKNKLKAKTWKDKHTQEMRELVINPDPSGITTITMFWYHLHISHVHARAMNGETFILTSNDVPVCYIKPLEDK